MGVWGVEIVDVSVCLSITRQYCIEMAARIELLYFMHPSTYPS